MYHLTFEDPQGYSAARVYYAQVMGLFSGKFWDGSAMVASPAHADTVVAITNLNSSGVYGITVPGIPTSKRYKVIIRQRAGGSPANTDNILHDEKIEVLFDNKVRSMNMDVKYG